jgi:exo-1,4-beta-D-glucosaminidase
MLAKAHAQAYEAHRAMVEAISRDKYARATGVIHWMFNAPWPSFVFNVLDYFLQPTAAYYGLKKALETLHCQYSYDDATIWCVNSEYVPAQGAGLRIYACDVAGAPLCNVSHVLGTLPADSSSLVLELPAACRPQHLPAMLTLRLDRPGSAATFNTYWLAPAAGVDRGTASMDVVNWSECNWFRCNVSHFADLSALAALPTVALNVEMQQQARRAGSLGHGSSGAEAEGVISVSNPSLTTIAFLVRLRLVDHRDGTEVAPAWFDDNYFTLHPSESRSVTVRYAAKYTSAVVVAEAFNNRLVPTGAPTDSPSTDAPVPTGLPTSKPMDSPRTNAPTEPPSSQAVVVATLVGSIMIGSGCIISAIVYAMRSRSRSRSIEVRGDPAYVNIR